MNVKPGGTFQQLFYWPFLLKKPSTKKLESTSGAKRALAVLCYLYNTLRSVYQSLWAFTFNYKLFSDQGWK